MPMQVLNRSRDLEDVRFDRVSDRIARLAALEPKLGLVDPALVTGGIARRIHDGITTREIDDLSADLCASMMVAEPEYGILAGRIVVDNHHRSTAWRLAEVVATLHGNEAGDGSPAPLVSDELLSIVSAHEEDIQSWIDFDRDYLLDFFAFRTLAKGYMLSSGGRIVERPQHLFVRVALGIHGADLSAARETYDSMSQRQLTHATPTLFHAGTPRPQMSSCYLLGTGDSVEAIYKTLTDCALISKWAGGIGVHVSNIRARGAYIRKTGGRTDGILRMLQVYNASCRFINQSGKRNGSIAIYLEPWHADVFDFIEAKKNHGSDDERARDLFYALWVPDLFMERVRDDGDWHLMCPDESPGLPSSYGKEFERIYASHVEAGRFRRKIPARELWKAIISSQAETGNPYMCYKDATNRKSNQSHLGVTNSSNLCAEITLVSNTDEYAVCNLCSICLPSVLRAPRTESLREAGLDDVVLYGKDGCSYCRLAEADLRSCGVSFRVASPEETEAFLAESGLCTVPQLTGSDGGLIGGSDALWDVIKPVIDHDELKRLAALATRNLNRVIDRNFYPVPESRASNERHRPLGIGVQGFADLLVRLREPFESEEASRINREVFETIYFGALEASCSLAAQDGPHPSYAGSPLSRGILQPDMWEATPSGRHDWVRLREDLRQHGARNSMLVAVMPTASTSQIMGNNECCEPYTSNVYTRRTLAGEFTVVNKHLVWDLQRLGLWTSDTRDSLLFHRGSVQSLTSLPRRLRDAYKTVWEIPQKTLIDLAAERGPYVCQSQSLNLWFSEVSFKKLTRAHLYGWERGLKTGSYYVRSRPEASCQRFGMEVGTEKRLAQEEQACNMCSG